MGCSASSPESVIGGAILANDISDLNSYPENNQNAVMQASELEKNLNNREQDVIQETKSANLENGDFMNLEKISIGKDPLPDIVSSNESEALNSIECKKGYVAFEVSLNGTVETTLDSTKHPLPKRLKHLQPLEGAPKLTAEELNEKLEKAERKRLGALAKRKNGVCRRSDAQHGPSTSRPDQTGDKINDNTLAQLDDTMKNSEDEMLHANEQRDSGANSRSTSSLLSDALDSRGNDENEDDSSTNQQIMDVLDLNNSNNNANVLKAATANRSTKNAIMQYDMHHFGEKGRYLNVVAELDEEE